MSLGLSESRRRRHHRRNWGGVIKWSALLLVLGAAGVYAYEVGSTLARQDVKRLEQDIARVAEDLASLQVENTELVETVRQRDERIEELSARYRRDVPAAEVRDVLALIDARIADGVSAERLNSVVAAARNDPPCAGEPVTRRFSPSTPRFTNAADTVRFADGAITVSGLGESSKDGAGNLQAWFDPALSISLRFSRLGGENEEISGVLPLHHSVVVGGAEYRFSAVAGDRSFVEITADRCEYP